MKDVRDENGLEDEKKELMLQEMKDVRDENGNILRFMVEVPGHHIDMLKAVYESQEFQASRGQFQDQLRKGSPGCGGSCGKRKAGKWQHAKRTVRLSFSPPCDLENTTASSSSQHRWDELSQSADEM